MSGCRYGFNGKENDNEVKGEGNQQDYGMRIYDGRVGRFLSVDPLTQKYPWYTPYQFAGNTPIQATDLDGTEEYHYTLSFDKNGRTHLELNSVEVYKEHSFLGFKWTTPIYTERAVVKFEGKNYYIGFAGSYGRGNEDGMALFNKFKLSPDASLFSQMFLSEDKSYNVEEYSLAIQMQNNAAMYGPLTSRAWYTPNESINTGVSLKEATPQLGKLFKSNNTKIGDGRISMITAKGAINTTGRYDFVVTNEGQLVIGAGHYNLSGGASSVKAAGELKLINGQVREITNSSGHYKPTVEQGTQSVNILQSMGVKTKGARVTLYNSDGSLNKTYINK